MSLDRIHPVDWDELEARAEELDASTLDDGELRRGLLRDLDAAGVFERAPTDAVRAAAGARPALRGYLEAAAALHRYLGSAERRAVFADEPRGSVLTSRISIDWFRRGPYTHERFTPAEWLLYLEQWLQCSESELAGTAYVSHGFIRAQVVTRDDGGTTPALVRAGDRCGQDGTVITDEVATDPLHPDVELERVTGMLGESHAALVAYLSSCLAERAPRRAVTWRTLATALEALDEPDAATACRAHAEALLGNAGGAPVPISAETLREAAGLDEDDVAAEIAAVADRELRGRLWRAMAQLGLPRFRAALCAFVSDRSEDRFSRTYVLKRFALLGDTPLVRRTLIDLVTTGERDVFGPYLDSAIRGVGDPKWVETTLGAMQLGRLLSRDGEKPRGVALPASWWWFAIVAVAVVLLLSLLRCLSAREN